MDRAIRQVIEAKYDRCVNRVVHRLRRINSSEWQGDDAPERNLWDHWKRELQEEQSVVYELLEDLVRDVVWTVVEQLPHEDGVLLTLNADAFDDLGESQDEPAFMLDVVAEELLSRVDGRAVDEPHRPEVQRLLDGMALDRYDRDMDPYR